MTDDDAPRSSSPDRQETPSLGTSPAKGLTIDELSAQTGVPSRTIRFYQSKGALAAPKKHGRVAYYSPQHAERLVLIGQLQDRGLNLRAIRDLFSRAKTADVSVSEWLGFSDKLRAPSLDDEPQRIRETELTKMFGEHARPGLAAEFVRAGMVTRDERDPTIYHVSSPALFQIGLELARTGISFDAAVGAREILVKRLSRMADDLAKFFFAQLEKDAEEFDVASVSEAAQALRSRGPEAVRLIFMQQMDRAVREVVESGKALPKERKRARPKK